MKKNKDSIRAQSEIITTVLMILLVLAVIIIVWQVVKSTVVIGAEKVEIMAFTTQLEIQNAKLWVTGGAEIMVKKGSGEGKIDSMKFIFEKQDGETKVIERKKEEGYEMPDELETKIYYFSADEINEKIERVGVVPVFGKNTGMDVYENKPLKNEVNKSSGLISWWKLDGDAKDSVGENDGTSYGGVDLNYNDAIRKKVASFDGSDDYIAAQGYPISSELTMSLWVYFNSLTADYQAPLNSNPNEEWRIGITPAPSGNLFFDAGSHDDIYTSSAVSAGAWHHLAITSQNSGANYNYKAYIDGEEMISGVIANNIQPVNSIYLGSRGGQKPTNGLIDDAMIFNRSLSAEEITAIYNNQKM